MHDILAPQVFRLTRNAGSSEAQKSITALFDVVYER
jgi:hypothetical protein